MVFNIHMTSESKRKIVLMTILSVLFLLYSVADHLSVKNHELLRRHLKGGCLPCRTSRMQNSIISAFLNLMIVYS